MIDHNKITPAHLRRAAIVYIRQSTAAQVESHRESTARQYALALPFTRNFRLDKMLCVVHAWRHEQNTKPNQADFSGTREHWLHSRAAGDQYRCLPRTELAAQVCQRFGFHDARGREQLAGGLKALRALEGGGHVTLPKASTPPKRKPSPRRWSAPVAAPRGVPTEVGEVHGLELILVKTAEQMRLWNELMASEHPQGAGPLVGRQLRYLIGSAHGWLGGLGFAAAALQLADRDAGRSLGWRAAPVLAASGGWQASRFRLRPSVVCHNLASQVLSLSLLALADDFERHYGYRPWLAESFVDTEHYPGACYRAANGRSRWVGLVAADDRIVATGRR